jgi:GNAT superfamily N-acetyltransferase
MSHGLSEQLRIKPVQASDCDHVGVLVSRLLTELYPDFASYYAPDKLAAVAREILETSQTTFGFLALDRLDHPVGVVMLNECAAIYAHGIFGEITEIYVSAEYRSAGVGARLIDTTIEFARSRGWSLIEVGAPDVPRWQKTVEFYIRNGFREVGPRLYLPLT